MKTPEFACGTSAYLNNASVSPMPVESIKAVSEFLTKYSQMGPDSAESEPFVTETLQNQKLQNYDRVNQLGYKRVCYKHHNGKI